MKSKGVSMIVLASATARALVGRLLAGTQAWAHQDRAQPLAQVVLAGVVSATVSYQGRLMEGGAPAQGSRVLTYSVCTQENGGAPVWLQTGNVTVAGGLFTVNLNTPQGLFDRRALWLGVQVARDVAELSPRQPLLPAPSALALRPGAIVSASLDMPLLAGTLPSRRGSASASA